MNTPAQHTKSFPAQDELLPFHSEDWAALASQAVEERLQTSTLAGLSNDSFDSTALAEHDLEACGTGAGGVDVCGADGEGGRRGGGEV